MLTCLWFVYTIRSKYYFPCNTNNKNGCCKDVLIATLMKKLPFGSKPNVHVYQGRIWEGGESRFSYVWCKMLREIRVEKNTFKTLRCAKWLPVIRALRAATNVYFHPWFFSKLLSQLRVVFRKYPEVLKNTHYNFPKPRATSLLFSFYPTVNSKPKHIEFMTEKSSKSSNWNWRVLHFCLINWTIIRFPNFKY